jgi:hypothetical protein
MVLIGIVGCRGDAAALESGTSEATVDAGETAAPTSASSEPHGSDVSTTSAVTAESSTSGGSAGEGSTSGTTGENGTPPAPGGRWVLVDGDGVELNAAATPTCRSSTTCALPEIGHVGAISPECVRLRRLRKINATVGAWG